MHLHLASILLPLTVSLAAVANICPVTETYRLEVQTNSFEPLFGAAISMSGDWVLVGERGYAVTANKLGAAHFLRPATQGNGWEIVQTFQDSTNFFHQFGASVGMEGPIAVVGSPQDRVNGLVNSGSASVYRLVLGPEPGPADDQWVFETKLVPSDPTASQRFGTAVAIEGNTIIIGGLQRNRVYVFQHDGAAWNQVQVIEPPAGDALTTDQFGTGLSISGGFIAIGSPGHDQAATNAGAVYMYQFNAGAGQWEFQVKLIPNDAAAEDRVGTVLAMENGRLIVGVPSHDLPQHSGGAAYSFELKGGTWTQMQKLTSPDLVFSDAFGSSVAIDGDVLVIGAENKDVMYYEFSSTAQRAGVGYVLENVGNSWAFKHQLRQHAFDSLGTPPAAMWNLGAAAGVDNGRIVLGAPYRLFSEGRGAVLFFDVTPPDCDGNGVPDVCDPDCNNNLVNDACEIAAGDFGDCNGNLVPDVCEQQPRYVIDNGFGQGVWGAGTNGVDLLWLNQFHVKPGGQHITHIAMAWTAFTQHGYPVTLLIYDDPNNDGDPHDAVLLANVSVSGIQAFGFSAALRYTVYNVPRTFVGEEGDSFFVGAFASLAPNTYAALDCQSMTGTSRKWRINSAFGTGSYVDIAANPTITEWDRDWAVRAYAMDCNGNDAWDMCDVLDGPSLDYNQNGIPDECEDHVCVGDIYADFVVNVNDLLAVINAWGACPASPPPCAADVAPLGGDGVVNVNDLLTVINGWGPCK